MKVRTESGPMFTKLAFGILCTITWYRIHKNSDYINSIGAA